MVTPLIVQFPLFLRRIVHCYCFCCTTNILRRTYIHDAILNRSLCLELEICKEYLINMVPPSNENLFVEDLFKLDHVLIPYTNGYLHAHAHALHPYKCKYLCPWAYVLYNTMPISGIHIHMIPGQ